MVLFGSILSNREERKGKLLVRQRSSRLRCARCKFPWCLMRDVVRLYFLVRLRNSMFLSYSPNTAVSLMSMARTTPITPLTHILHMTSNASGAPCSAWSEKTSTNGHMWCWSQTHTTSSDPSHPRDRYLGPHLYLSFLVDLFEIYIFFTWYSLVEHMFCLELGKVCKTNT